MAIEWKECHARIEGEVIDRVAATLRRELPDDYRRTIEQCHGGYPSPSEFYYDDPDYGETEGTVGELLSFDASYSDNILRVVEDLKAQQPSGLVPIAHDGGGNFICLDYRDSATNPSIVFWLHEKRRDKSVVLLSQTWTSFLESLHEADDEEFAD
jgi:cell wall assembly regulator SMI1